MRWGILALLFGARVGMGLQFQTLGSVGDELGVAFGLNYAGIGLLIGLFMAPGLVLALPAGLANRYASDRMLAVSGMLALAVGGYVSGIATDVWLVGVGRAIAGAGFLLGTLYFTKMVADWFSGREIATAMSVLVMSWPFGIAMGQIGHVWLAEVYDWRVPFQVASTYCLLAAVCLAVFYRPPQSPALGRAPYSSNLTSQEWKLIVCAGVAWGVFNAGYIIYLSFGPLVLEAQGQSGLKAAGVVSLTSWVMILSCVLCGQIVDRFGRRDLVLLVCMAGAVVSLVLLITPGGPLLASLSLGLIGMAPAGVIMALAGEALRPESRAFGMGVFFTIYHAVMMASPPVAGAMMDAMGSANAPIVLAMILFACVALIALVFRWVQKRDGTSHKALRVG